MNSIKEILIEAGRYESVVKALEHIPERMSHFQSYPLQSLCVIEDGKYEWELEPIIIAAQSKDLLEYIRGDCESIDYEEIDTVSEYIENESDCMLHSYAVSVSHRDESDVDIRLFYVPGGWKYVE